MTQSGLDVGHRVDVRANGRKHNFVMAGDLPGVAPGQELAVIDIASAQWRFGRLGTLDRIDVKLKPGIALVDAKAQLSSILPANTQLSDAETESQRGNALSRAYRVNLDMLALVALMTGGFLVYSAQSLAVTRRLRQFALLRTLGLQKRALAGQLLGEGAALGVVGALIGLLGGYAIAGVALHLVGGDLGAGYFAGATTTLEFAPEAAVLFFGFGVATALAGSYAPARRAARIAPALALKNAGDQGDPRRPPSIFPALALISAGAVCAGLPAVNRLPLFGYLAVGLVLAGGVAAMPWVTRRVLRPLGRAKLRVPAFEMALGRLLGAPGQASIACRHLLGADNRADQGIRRAHPQSPTCSGRRRAGFTRQGSGPLVQGSCRPAAIRSCISASVKARSLRGPISSAPTIDSPRKMGSTTAPPRPVARAPGRTSPLASVWMLQASTGRPRSTASPAMPLPTGIVAMVASTPAGRPAVAAARWSSPSCCRKWTVPESARKRRTIALRASSRPAGFGSSARTFIADE